jgi:hypothetical protein
MTVMFVICSIVSLSDVQARPMKCPAHGTARMERPKTPPCVAISFEGDDTNFEVCKKEMDDFKTMMQDYLDCERAEASEAANQYEAAVQSFNCNAQGSPC